MLGCSRGRRRPQTSLHEQDAFLAMSATLEGMITMLKFPNSAADEGVPVRPARRATSFLSRREVIAAAAAGGALVAAGSAHAQTFGNPDEPPEGAGAKPIFWSRR
jgi:hypothetical protein